jgi:glycosyltransferase involved in cell wall biosynthesis
VAERAEAEQGAGEDLDFSVVVPTKGRPRELERCLTGLAKLRYPPGRFEIVVVNDGGGEAAAKLSGSFGARVVVPWGTGPSSARNAGAAAGRGRWVAFIDDDCEPDPRWLESLRAALIANPGAAVGGPTLNAMDQDRGAVASQAVVDALHDELNRGPGPPRFFDSSNLAVEREDFLAFGGFDEGFRYAEDREMCERWLRSGRPLVESSEAVVHHLRTLTARQFVGQHYGYGRGAFAFRRSRGDASSGETRGVIRGLARRTLRPDRGAARPSLFYLVLSQVATAAGFLRQAVADLIEGRDRPPIEPKRSRVPGVASARSPRSPDLRGGGSDADEDRHRAG